MQWRRRMKEESDARDLVDTDAVAAPDADDASTTARGVNMATSVDDMNFFGAIGGGELTREGIANARKTRSPALDAMEELQRAVRETGNLPAAEAAAELSRVIGEAYEAGVAVTAPPMKKAAALLSALETAAAGPSMEDEDATDTQSGEKSLDSKLDSLFGGGYAMPELDLED